MKFSNYKPVICLRSSEANFTIPMVVTKVAAIFL